MSKSNRIDIEFDIRLIFCMASCDGDEFDELVKNGCDWNRFYKYCVFHGLAGLFYYNKLKDKQLIIPGNILQSFKSHYFQNSIRNRAISDNISIVGSDFHNKGIDFIVLKGYFLLEKVYPDFGSRFCGDIDFLIREGDNDKMATVFESKGFKPFYMKYLSFKKGKSKVVLNGFYNKEIVFDFHNQIFSSPLKSFQLDSKLWDSSINIKLADIQLKSLSPEMVFIHLCHHTYRHLIHGNIRLSNFYDLYFLLQSENWKPDFDKIQEIVSEFEILYAIKFSCSCIYNWFPKGKELIPNNLIITILKNMDYSILKNDKSQLMKINPENNKLRNIAFLRNTFFPPFDYLRIKFDFVEFYKVPYFYFIHVVSNINISGKWLASLLKGKR